jgi:ATP-dependent Zn protease
MRNAFIQARKLAPAILFIDELDGISDRSRLQGDYVEYWSQIVNLLLELLAGIDDREGVVVVGATNHPDMIDPAVRRAGRLDQTITIDLPETDDLCQIFRFYLKDDLADADLVPLALAARGRTGADVESWVRRARSTARRRNRVVKIDDVMHEIKGEQAKLPHDLRNIVAIHEAGHIVVGAALGCYEPDRAWITHNGGLTIGEVNATSHLTLRGLENIITMLLGGRAAEKLMLGAEEVTIGSGLGDQSDLQKATDIACDIETRFGFGECGLVRLPDSSRALMLHDRETVASIRNRLQRCHLKAETIIQLHCAAILEIATALRDEGYVERSELLQIFKEHNLENRDP